MAMMMEICLGIGIIDAFTVGFFFAVVFFVCDHQCHLAL